MLTCLGFTIMGWNQNVPLTCEWTTSLSPLRPSHLELFQVAQEKKKIYFWNQSENCCSLLFRFIASVELKWKKGFFLAQFVGEKILRNPKCMIYKCKDTYVNAFWNIFKIRTQSNPLRSVCHILKSCYLIIYHRKIR